MVEILTYESEQICVHFCQVEIYDDNIDYHSPGAFQKKASILFGIELNDESIADMEEDLKRISGYRDLVSIFYRLFTV